MLTQKNTNDRNGLIYEFWRFCKESIFHCVFDVLRCEKVILYVYCDTARLSLKTSQIEMRRF